MFGLSLSHLIIFGIIALIVIGPEQLPEVARAIARFLNELKRASSDLQGQFRVDLDQPPPPSYHPPQPPKLEEPEKPAAEGHEAQPDQDPMEKKT